MSSYLRHRKRDVVFGVLFVQVFVFLLWKIQFGFANIDESFYLTIPLRLLQGDALFAHEWHLSQMSSVLLLPFAAGFMAIRGNTDGILLTFRILYVLVHSASALVLYRQLKKWNWIGASVGALCFLIYAPFGISAMSYNSLGIDTLVIACVLYASCEEKNIPAQAASGFLLGCAVLCCPYLVVVYLYFSIAECYRFFFRKEKTYRYRWLAVTGGAGAAAIIFLTLVFSRVSVQKLILSLTPIFNDPEHGAFDLRWNVQTYFLAVLLSTGRVSKTIYFGFLLIFAAGLLDRKQVFAKPLFFAALLLTALLLISYYKTLSYLNFLMFPLNAFACCCMPLVKDSKAKKLFRYVWVPGMLYSFCIHCTSNQGWYVITSASAAAFVSSVSIIALTAEQLCRSANGKTIWKSLICFGLACLFGLQLVTELRIRYAALFWDRPMQEQTERIEAGPEKGILVTPSRAADYYTLCDTIQNLEEYQKADSVLFLSNRTWLYLIEPKEMSAYSAWLSGVNNASIERLAVYYQLNPDKLPDCIFLSDSYAELLPKINEKLSGGTIPVVIIPSDWIE